MAYSIERVKEEFHKVCKNAGAPCKVSISANGRLTRTLGRVVSTMDSSGYCENLKVEFSKKFLETATDKSIKDVILHEAAHYIVIERTHTDHGHDNYFKRVCAELGTDNDGISTVVEKAVETHDKYEIICPNCNKIVGSYSRMCKTLQNLSYYSCKQCKKSDLYYKQNW